MIAFVPILQIDILILATFSKQISGKKFTTLKGLYKKKSCPTNSQNCTL